MPLDRASQPHLDLTLSHPKMRDLFVQSALPALFPGHRLNALHRHYTRYKAGKEHVTLFSLGLDPPPDGAPPFVTVTIGRPGRVRNAYQRISGSRNGLPRALLLPEDSCLFAVFPADSGLPLLSKAADSTQAAELLAPMLPAQPISRVMRIDVLRYRPGRRCVLLFEIEMADGTTLEIVGKLYRDGGRAQAVARKLAALCRQTSGQLLLPEPVGDPGELPLLLMKRLRGSNLGDQLESTTSREENERSVRAAAAALAGFHRLALESDQRRSLQTELGQLQSRLEPVRHVEPDLAAEVGDLLTQLEAPLAQLPPAADCLIHGEYKPNQLLLSHGRIAVVDLDRACLGDPAIDVGNFMAVLRKEVLLEGHTHLEGLDQVFLAEYESAQQVTGLAKRAKLFESIAFLRMLTRHFERAPQQYGHRGDDWPPLALLHEARRSLASL